MNNSMLYTKITHSLAIPLVGLAAKVLADSEVPADMMCASYLIQHLERFYPQFHQLLLEHKSLIRSSLAISTCQNAPDLTKKTAERVLVLFYPQLRALDPKDLQIMIEQRTASDSAASRRADRLRRVVFAEDNYTPDQPRFSMKRVKDFQCTPGKMPSFKKDESTETFILGPAVEKKHEGSALSRDAQPRSLTLVNSRSAPNAVSPCAAVKVSASTASVSETLVFFGRQRGLTEPFKSQSN
jgi:hypothetical protein